MIAMASQLDRLLGRVTMYGLVIICLTGIAVAAVAEMAVGLLDYSPLGFLAVVSTSLILSYLANGFAGLIFRSRPQLSSTAITALLLPFIFPPTPTLASLAGVAVAAVVAVAGKYLLAIRGRHIFNPAALGVFVTSLTGLTFGAWWVGTPPLLAFVAVGAFLVLWRTRRLPLAGVFLFVAAMSIAVQTALFGSTFLTGLYYAFLSAAIVFFAGFMLDEPLTLPPRRWQQLLEAAVVGLLFQLPSVGSFAFTPEFALLIGNLLAFFFGQRRGIRLDFVSRSQLTPTSWQFEFRPHVPVKFLPGQYMELSLPHGKTDARGWRRVFSIASAPGGDIRFGMRVPERSSSFKAALLALEPGATVSATSVSGDFLLPKDAAKPLLLVAAGIGITPFVSQLDHLSATGEKRDIVLLYSVQAAEDIAFGEVLRAADCRVVVLSPTRPSELPAGWSWAGEGALSAEQIRKAVPDAASRTTYLSGSPELVAGLERALHADGVKRIVTDVFIGY